MIRQQLYSPDTCACKVLESWDDAVPQDQVVHTLVAIVYRCPQHASVLDDSLYGLMVEENTRKNVGISICLEEVPALGNDASLVVWLYTAGRTLHLSVPSINLDRQTKAAIQTACDTTLGLGRVVID